MGLTREERAERAAAKMAEEELEPTDEQADEGVFDSAIGREDVMGSSDEAAMEDPTEEDEDDSKQEAIAYPEGEGYNEAYERALAAGNSEKGARQYADVHGNDA